MPFDYQRDDVNRRIIVTYDGVFDAAEGITILNRHRDENVAPYAILYNFNGLTGQPTVSDMKRFIEVEAGNVPTQGMRGPIALVARDAEIYRMACTYAVLGDDTLKIRVFREREEAEDWLTERQALTRTP